MKKIIVDKKLGDTVALDVTITPELRAEGVLRDIARLAQELRQKAELQPKDRIAVAESAIRTAEDIRTLAGVGAQAFLIGETLMGAEHPGEKLRELMGT